MHEEHRIEWYYTVCTDALYSGSRETLQYVCEHGAQPNTEACEQVLWQTDVTLLRYVHERGWPVQFRGNWLDYHLRSGHRDMVVYMLAYVDCTADQCAAAAVCTDVSMLCLLRERGCAWDERVVQNATRRKCIDVLRYALEHDAPCDAAMRSRAERVLRRCGVLRVSVRRSARLAAYGSV